MHLLRKQDVVFFSGHIIFKLKNQVCIVFYLENIHGTFTLGAVAGNIFYYVTL
tara:strand:+ start:561 stop:719 length:159 start_codon:yes stop_codon:yes gene_type:complete